MPYFRTEQDMVDAMPGAFAKAVMRTPSNLTKAARKKVVPPNVFGWLDCRCTGMPYRNGVYSISIDNNCSDHANVKSDFEPPRMFGRRGPLAE